MQAAIDDLQVSCSRALLQHSCNEHLAGPAPATSCSMKGRLGTKARTVLCKPNQLTGESLHQPQLHDWLPHGQSRHKGRGAELSARGLFRK